jgi:diguanylate cyclase (GGDEF)-like protein
LQTNYSSNQLVVHLDVEGYIKKVVLNTYPTLEVSVGEMAIHLFSDDSKTKYFDQFSQVLVNDVSFGMRVELSNELAAIGFFVKHTDVIILVMLSMQDEIIALFDELVNINNEQVSAIRDLTKKVANTEDSATWFNEMMLVNNALINVRRELSQRNQQLEALNHELERVSLIDYLTQLPNRRKFFKDVYRYVDSMDYRLTMMDFNNFKAVNDEFGHQRGDELLIEFAIVMSDYCVQIQGDLYRLGGDEFAVLTPASMEVDFDSIFKDIDGTLKEFHPLISMAYGSVIVPTGSINQMNKIETYMHQADKIMFQIKKEFHKKHNINERGKKA